MEERTALLIRCTKEEARRIREAAAQEHRTISGFMLHTALGHIERSEEMKRKIAEQLTVRRKRS